MEAAVLNSAIIPEVDCNSNTVDAELEVKKLQQLVRTLEWQNELLRTRASSCSRSHVLPPSPWKMLAGTGGFCLPSPVPTLLCESSLGSSLEEPFDYFYSGDGAAEDGSEPSVLDELELLDFDSLCCSDESDETWLYVSSKSRECSDNSLSALQWCRKALESPRSEVEAARRSLCLRLEQVSRWRSSLSSPSPTSSPGLPLSRVAGVSPLTSSPCAKPSSTLQSSERHVSSLSSPFHHRTMSPVGKDHSPFSERTPTFFPAQHKGRSLRRCALSPQSSMDSDLGSSEVDDDSISLGYKLQDLTDVQVMARLQEENLRAHHYFSFINPRRSKAGLCQHVVRPGPPPQSELHLPAQRRARPGGGRRGGGRRRLRPPAPRAASPHPPAPLPYFLQRPRLAKKHQLPVHPALHSPSPLRRVRLPASAPNPAARLQARVSQSFDSSSGLARLQSSIPSPGQLQNRVQSVGNFSSMSRQTLKATAYVSPTIKGSMATSTSLHSLNSSSSGSSGGGSGIPIISKAQSGGGAATSTPLTARSSLPRPASLFSTSSSTSRSKVAQSARSLLTPPKTLTTFSALRDSNWRDGCY
ncbi:SLAIN motif-containing protein 1-like isoform X4 [Pseudochaenichthys georgianus]|uniref:SLAIN motif-containing protein 1-like isoform X4 n=1 Tax=Pseudochaenichthys georgianus TaxID=52239 RepID=UPI0039C10247